MLRRRWTRVTWEPITDDDAAGWAHDVTKDGCQIAGPVVADRDWFRCTRVRLTRDMVIASPGDDGRLRRAGQVLTLVQTGRAGHAVDTSTWRTNSDADVWHTMADADVEVLEVLEHVPPQAGQPEITPAHGHAAIWHEAHRTVAAIQATQAADPDSVDRLDAVAVYAARRGAAGHLWDALNKLAADRVQLSPVDRRVLAATIAAMLRVSVIEVQRGTYEAISQVRQHQPAPTCCTTCHHVRSLVPDWDLCQPCYQASGFDPDVAAFLHLDPAERETDPAVLAEHQAVDVDAARHGESP